METNKIVAESLETGDEQIKITKGNRYYYRHREEILEKQRIARLKKKGVDITKLGTEQQTPLEERRKKKNGVFGVNGIQMKPCGFLPVYVKSLT